MIKTIKNFSKYILTLVSSYDKFIFVDKTTEQHNMEVYPSLAEGIGLENRQAGNTARGGSNPSTSSSFKFPTTNVAVFFCLNCMYYLLDTTSASVVVFFIISMMGGC